MRAEGDIGHEWLCDGGEWARHRLREPERSIDSGLIYRRRQHRTSGRIAVCVTTIFVRVGCAEWINTHTHSKLDSTPRSTTL